MPGNFALSALDWSIFAAYFALVFYIAWIFGRRQHSTVKQYFLANDSIPWFAVGASMIASSLSTEQMIGTNGASYKYGFCIAQWDCYTLPPVTMLVWIFLPIYLRRRISTIPEFLAQRYGEGLRDAFAFIAVLSYPFVFLSVVLYSGSVLFSSLFPFQLTIHGHDATILFWSTVMIVFTVIYTVWGGLAAVVWTDSIQFLILFASGLIIFVCGIRAIAGSSGPDLLWHGWLTLRSSQMERFHLIQPIDHPLVPWPSLIMRIVTTQLYYNCANQFIVQRALAAKSDWDARMGALSYAAAGLVLPFVDIFPGMIAYQLNPHLADANRVVPYLLRTVIPAGWGMRGFILAGMAAAVMSTPSSLINSTSTVFTLDFYKKRLRPQASEGELLRAGRIASVMTAVCAVLWAPMVGNYKLIFTYFQSFLAYIAAPAGAIFLLGVFWKRASQKAALSALGIGLPFCLFIEFLTKSRPDYWLWFVHMKLGQVSFVYISFIGWVLSMAIMITISLLEPERAQPEIADLMWNRSAFTEPVANGAPLPWYKSLVLWYVIFVVVWIWSLSRFL
jgi:SSS family solute:Na+ symporter